MNPWLSVPQKTPGKFRIGDRVRILHGFKGMIGEVVEDRGCIGVGGRRFYSVKFRLDEWNERTSEIPEESLEAVAAASRQERTTKRKKKPAHRQARPPEDGAPPLDTPEAEHP